MLFSESIVAFHLMKRFGPLAMGIIILSIITIRIIKYYSISKAKEIFRIFCMIVTEHYYVEQVQKLILLAIYMLP